MNRLNNSFSFLPKRYFKLVLLNLLLAALYFGFGKLSLSTEASYISIIVDIVFPSEGIALAFALLWGYAVVPGIFLGQFALALSQDVSTLPAFAVGIINAFEAAVAVYLFRRWRLSLSFNRVNDVALFFVLIFFILQPISATGGVSVLYWAGMISGEDWLVAWAKWWLSNAFAQLLLAPLLISWLRMGFKQQLRINSIDLVFVFVIAAAIAILLWSNWQYSPIVLVMSYPILVWAGMCLSLPLLTLTSLIVALFLMFIAILGHGIMLHLSLLERVFYISIVVMAGSFTALLLHALLSERQALIQRLDRQVNQDELTNSWTRRYFMTQTKEAIKRYKPVDKPLSVAIVDADHFKQVNDTYGHLIGDEVLKMLGNAFKKILPSNVCVGRLGGEEFGVLFEGYSEEAAWVLLEKLREYVMQQSVPLENERSIRITISSGVTAVKEADALHLILHRADLAMYHAKQTGRNQTVRASQLSLGR